MNVSALLDPAGFRAGLAYETDHVATGGGRPFAGLLSASYLLGFASQTTWPVRVLALGFLAFVLASWRRRSFAERALALFPLLYLALLQGSQIKAIRYLLPAVVVAHALAGLAIASLAARLGGASPLRRAAVAALLLVVALGAEGRAIAVHLGEFAAESRRALYGWVREHVPPESVIVQDRYAGLPDPSELYTTPDQPYLPQLILTRHYAVDQGIARGAARAGRRVRGGVRAHHRALLRRRRAASAAQTRARASSAAARATPSSSSRARSSSRRAARASPARR